MNKKYIALIIIVPSLATVGLLLSPHIFHYTGNSSECWYKDEDGTMKPCVRDESMMLPLCMNLKSDYVGKCIVPLSGPDALCINGSLHYPPDENGYVKIIDDGCHNNDNSSVEVTLLDYSIEITALDVEIKGINSSTQPNGILEIRVIDPEEDNNKESIDWFYVHVWSDSDEVGIDFSVSETDESTGIFEGTVHLFSKNPRTDSSLLVSQGDTIYAQYREKTAQSEITFPLFIQPIP